MVDDVLETCDDGNSDDGDGCSSTCSVIESGYTCSSKYDYEGDELPEELQGYEYDTKC